MLCCDFFPWSIHAIVRHRTHWHLNIHTHAIHTYTHIKTQTATYLVAIFYIPLAVCAVGNAISQIADYYVRFFLAVCVMC